MDIVERWLPTGRGGLGVRKDLFGIGDLIAVRGDETALIQVTSRNNIASRMRKIGDASPTPVLREAGWLLLVHGWDQPGGLHHGYRLLIGDVS